jgi:uncharacterized membrane protein
LINFSCQGTRLQNKKKLSLNGKIFFSDSVIKKSQLKGIDFMASGNLPQKWNIKIDFDNECLFGNEEGLNIKAKPNATFKTDATKEVYTAVSGNKEIELTVYKEKCNNKKDKRSNAFITKVFYNGVNYEGCGQFLFDERVHQTWVLEYIDNEQQFALNYTKGIPYFKIDLIKSKITGYDGCNKLSSSIELKGNRILFGSLNNMPDKSLQSAALINQFISNHLVDYFFREDKLVFQLANDTRLTFKLK